MDEMPFTAIQQGTSLKQTPASYFGDWSVFQIKSSKKWKKQNNKYWKTFQSLQITLLEKVNETYLFLGHEYNTYIIVNISLLYYFVCI